MKKITMLVSMLLLLAAGIISSCGGSSDDPEPEVDTTKPSIEFIKPKSDGSTVYGSGSPMDFNAVFKDDQALKNCVVTISYTEVASKSVLKGIGEPWAPAAFTIDFNGEKEKTITENLFDQPIEQGCLAGEYTLKFVVTDKSDNEHLQLVTVNIE